MKGSTAGVAFSDTRMLPLYRRLLRYGARRRLALAAVAATQLAEIVINLLRPWPLAIVVDSVLGAKALPQSLGRVFAALPGGQSPQDLLTWAALATLLVFVLGWLLTLASELARISFGERMQYDLAADLLRHLQRLSLTFHSQQGAGDLMRRITVDSGCVATIVRDGLLPCVTSVLGLVAVFTVMLQIDPVLTVLALGVLPPMVVALRRFAGPMAEHDYAQQEAEGQVYGLVEQSLAGIATVQAFGTEPREVSRFRRTSDRVLALTLAATAVQVRFRVLIGTVTAVGTAGIMYVGGRHALAGQLSAGEIFVFLAYLAGLYLPLESLMYTATVLQGAAGSAYRVMEVLDTAPDVPDGPLNQVDRRPAGHVRLDDVCFSYAAGRPVLDRVSLEAWPGELVALVGPTGAGKSTLAGLVVRLLDPDSGQVLLDGVDARSVTTRVWRDQVALVLQESFLFPLSIADNIAFGRPGATRGQVVAAAEAANAHDFVLALPDGYDTVVGERGATLSGGQRQRIAIARALLKDAPVLVLDEPTSGLDAATEDQLLLAIDRLVRGRTTLVIAHRLSTVRRADRIVVLDGGRVVETGPHEELLSRQGRYAQMHAAQHGARSARAPA